VTDWSKEVWDEPDPARLQTALRLLRLACEPGATVADLGCLHGAYAVEFARQGYRTTGIEARPVNLAKCRQRAAEVKLDGLSFVQDDVRNIDSHGTFDAVFCCGILYHLDEPAKFLRTLGQVTNRLLIVQTHFAITANADNEGHDGHWYEETGGAGNPWASWGNERSFWLTKRDLMLATQEAGFDLVFECHDYLQDICGVPSRVMYAAVKL
jgi:SAM-dependent methyltransferase